MSKLLLIALPHGDRHRYDAVELPHSAIQDSGRSSIIVVQPSTETFPALDRACVYEVVWVRLNQAVAQPLVVSLAVIMSCEVLNGCPQRTFPEQDQPFEAGLLDAAHEALGVGIQIWTSRWQFDGFHTGILQRAQKFFSEQRVPIMDQVTIAHEQAID